MVIRKVAHPTVSDRKAKGLEARDRAAAVEPYEVEGCRGPP